MRRRQAKDNCCEVRGLRKRERQDKALWRDKNDRRISRLEKQCYALDDLQQPDNEGNIRGCRNLQHRSSGIVPAIPALPLLGDEKPINLHIILVKVYAMIANMNICAMIADNIGRI